MKTQLQMVQHALAACVALGLAGAAAPALAAKGSTEKCAGIVKAGQNDCGTSRSSCAGTSKVDRDPEAWISVPKGTCARIVGGQVTNKPENVQGGATALKKN